jgi:hypothetical protein
MADETVCNEQFTQLVGGAVEHRTIGEGLVHLQMSLLGGELSFLAIFFNIFNFL